VTNFSQIRRQFHSAGLELLRTDLDVALTFMEVAATTHDPETVRRNHNNALRAYDTVLGFMLKLELTEAERETLEAKLAVVRTRLAAAGFDR
jgi:hypothetical protein